MAIGCVLALLQVGAAEARQGVAAVRGRVMDQQEGVLPGVTVTVTHRESGVRRETVSGSDGSFSIPALVPGPYQLNAELPGFGPYQLEEMTLRVGATAQIEIVLQVGGLTEAVTVTSEAPQVDLTSTEVGGTVSTAEMTTLPSGNRNFTGFVALLPGVVYNPTSDSSSDNVTINGQHGSGVVYLMDGASNNDDLRGGSAGAQARMPLEAIQEFQVVTNQFDAEYGGATAGVINAVSKQGTNSLRGSAFGFFTNESFTARDFLVAQQDLPKPDASRKQWGGTIGGPIIRDKMHFFVSFERSDLDEGRSRVYPTRPDKSFTATQETNSYNYLGRIDHQLGSNANYSVRALWDHQPNYNQVLGDGTKDTLYTEKDNDVSLVAAFNAVTRPTQLLTLRASWVHEKPERGMPQYFEAPWSEAPPMLDFLSFYDQAGNDYADVRTMDIYAFDTAFTWFIPGRIGSHDVKMGTQYQYGEHLRDDQRYTNGSFSFATDEDYNPSDPFTYPERLTIRVPNRARVLSHTHSIGLYVHDKWRVTDNLTLNLGLRYDLHISPFREAWNPFFPDSSGSPIDKNNFQPRTGFAYSLGERSVIRGGYGLFYEKQWIDRFEAYQLNRVFSDSFIAQYPTNAADPGPSHGQFPTNPFLVDGPVLNRTLLNQLISPGSLARNTGDVFLDNPDRILPAQHQMTVGFERQVRDTLSFAIDYMHSWTRDQPLRYNFNPGIRANTSRTGRITRVDFLDLAGQLGLSPFVDDVYTYRNMASSQYDGLAMQLEKRFANYWSGRVSYSIGYARGTTNGVPTATNDFQVLEDANLELNEGPTNYDRRHTLSLSGRLDLPQLKGVTLAATARMMSGSPFTVYDSTFDLDLNGVLTDPIPAGTYTGVGQNAITVENSGGRNGAYGPGLVQLDVRAGYRLRAGGVRTLDLFAEVFNVTNRANFNNPTGDMRSGNFLVPTSLRSGGFPRQLQLGVRLGF
ncbi:MAG: TonB-dependent receptor [Acidobacteria bacterium]|nr:TonB-dependent receptor [Acidobacteriota bacterium]